jgi:hypothetical protein
MFSICENMVLQNPPTIYTHPVSTNRLFAKYMYSYYVHGYEMHRVFTRENNCIWANEIRQYMQLNTQV